MIIRRYDLTDEEHHRQMEKDIFEDTLTAEQKLRAAGDPAASIEIVSKAKSKAAPKAEEAASGSGGVAQIIGDQAEDQGSGYDDLLQEASTGAEDFNGDVTDVFSKA